MAIKKWVWKETAEVIGIPGIIAGIVFFGYELRQNNALLQSEASVAYMEERRGSYRALEEDTHLLGLLIKSSEGKELAEVEALSLDFFIRSVLINLLSDLRESELDLLQVTVQIDQKFTEAT